MTAAHGPKAPRTTAPAAARPVKDRCPACRQLRWLRPETGRCPWCSRTCILCGAPRRSTQQLCAACRRREMGQRALGPCAYCGRKRVLDPSTQRCRACTDPATTQPPTPCEHCQKNGQWAKGLCKRCYEYSPHTVITRAAGWAKRMPDPPWWWHDLAVHLAGHRHPIYAADLVATAARLILTTRTRDPLTLLTHARNDAPTLAGALTDFFRTHHHLAPPPGLADRRAAARRARRIQATPAPLRPQVQGFANFLVLQRERAPQLGLRPNQLKTIEIRLDAIRDLALHLHLHAEGHMSWASVTTAHLEAFLARTPARRASRLAGLRQFFAYAHRTKAVLHNPTDPITAVQQRGFNGPTLTLAEQRALYQRWTTAPGIHPHEAFIGLAALLHAATITELRHLTDTRIDSVRRTAQFPGRQIALPLDPGTWTALERCLEHRSRLQTGNPHLLVTRLTRTTRAPAGAAHIRDGLAPAGLLPRILRSTRLVTLAEELDIKVLTASVGMSYAGVAHYHPDCSCPT